MSSYHNMYIETVKTPKQYIDYICELQTELQIRTKEACKVVEHLPVPKNIRPCLPGDIVQGAVLWWSNEFIEKWYNDSGEDYFGKKWVIVKDVFCPDDEYKGFTSHDGSRYGYLNLVVEIKN